jgi:hypothetical protein
LANRSVTGRAGGNAFVDVSSHGYGRVLLNAVVFTVAFGAGAAAFAVLGDR